MDNFKKYYNARDHEGPLTITGLIALLEEVREKEGDLAVVSYDGGYAPIESVSTGTIETIGYGRGEERVVAVDGYGW